MGLTKKRLYGNVEVLPVRGAYVSNRFEAPDRVVVFTGDTGPSAAVTELARGADLLVSEVVYTLLETGNRSGQAPMLMALSF